MYSGGTATSIGLVVVVDEVEEVVVFLLIFNVLSCLGLLSSSILISISND